MLLLAGLLASQITSSIPVHHSRPTRLIERMGPLAVSDHFTLTADDLKGALNVDGAEGGVQEVRAWVNQFDEAPRPVEIKILIDSPLDKEMVVVTARIYNNQIW